MFKGNPIVFLPIIILLFLSLSLSFLCLCSEDESTNYTEISNTTIKFNRYNVEWDIPEEVEEFMGEEYVSNWSFRKTHSKYFFHQYFMVDLVNNREIHFFVGALIDERTWKDELNLYDIQIPIKLDITDQDEFSFQSISLREIEGNMLESAGLYYPKEEAQPVAIKARIVLFDTGTPMFAILYCEEELWEIYSDGIEFIFNSLGPLRKEIEEEEEEVEEPTDGGEVNIEDQNGNGGGVIIEDQSGEDGGVIIDNQGNSGGIIIQGQNGNGNTEFIIEQENN